MSKEKNLSLIFHKENNFSPNMRSLVYAQNKNVFILTTGGKNLF